MLVLAYTTALNDTKYNILSNLMFSFLSICIHVVYTSLFRFLFFILLPIEASAPVPVSGICLV